jgi:dihydroorotase
VDIHAHFREPGNEDAETVASGLAAAAHGGYTTVCLMPNTTPATDEPSVVARVRAAAAASGSPVRVLLHGAVTEGRKGETLAALGELADAGVVGFSDDGSPVRTAGILRNALAYAGALGLPIVDHSEDSSLTEGAEASEGYVATVLGLRGWPVAAETGAVARAIAILADVVRDEPGARLHLTHVSTAAALAHVRAAKAAGLPVTCDVTPHHLGFTDEWIAGSRRWAWEALDDAGAARDPWTDGALVAAPFDTALRVNPPLRSPVDAAACLAALADGTADAVATDHAPHTEVDKHVEFGWAANGISGIETAAGVVLAAVEAGRLPLARAIEALTTGPARVLGEPGARAGVTPGLREGEPADLVVIDHGASWVVGPDTLRSKGRNTPLAGRAMRGVVTLVIAGGRVAHADQAKVAHAG